MGVGGRWGVEGKEREKERSRDGEAAAMLGSVVKGMWVGVSWVPLVEAVSVTNKPRCRSPGRERGEHGGETAFCRVLHRGHRQELAAVTAWQGELLKNVGSWSWAEMHRG